jgi:hypothetical protein
MLGIDDINRLEEENKFLQEQLLYSKNLCFGFMLLYAKTREENCQLHARLHKSNQNFKHLDNINAKLRENIRKLRTRGRA